MKTVIKYGNRKLYDKETSKYVTLGELLKLPLGSFQVVTHGANVNITTETLLSALTIEGLENQTKIAVLTHCLSELNTSAVTQ